MVKALRSCFEAARTSQETARVLGNSYTHWTRPFTPHFYIAILLSIPAQEGLPESCFQPIGGESATFPRMFPSSARRF
jgi:hypothetical protein